MKVTQTVQVPITRIRIDRKTGKVISKEVIGHRAMPRTEYLDALVLGLTGMSTEEVCRRIMELHAEKEKPYDGPQDEP